MQRSDIVADPYGPDRLNGAPAPSPTGHLVGNRRLRLRGGLGPPLDHGDLVADCVVGHVVHEGLHQ